MQMTSKNTKMSKPKSDLNLIDRNFKEGSQVEISSYEKPFLGSWYNGTVIRLNKKSLTAVVEYKSRFDVKRKPLVEKVDLIQLRPLQVLQERRNFGVNEYVDVFYHDGWWEGMVTQFYGDKKLVVFFKHTRELRAVRVSKLRPHYEWVFGKWHPDLDEVPAEPPEVEVPVIKKRRVVNEVPVKSSKVEVRECKIKSRDQVEPSSRKHKTQSREVHVPKPSFSKRKTQLREVEVPKPSFSTRKIQSREVEVARPSFSKRKTQSPEVELPAFNKRKFRSPETEAPSVENHKIRSRMVEEPSYKKHKIQLREELFSHSKDIQLIDDMQIVPVSSGMPLSERYGPEKEESMCGFKPGQLVELSSKDEGFEGAWFPATVVQTLNANKCVIKYEHILADDEKSKLLEKVDSKLMRPCPPDVPRFDRFCKLEDVDAFYNDCWWVGAVTKVLIDDEYIVYFSTTRETMKFRHFQLRVHQKWINGQWVTPTMAAELE